MMGIQFSMSLGCIISMINQMVLDLSSLLVQVQRKLTLQVDSRAKSDDYKGFHLDVE